MDLKTIAQQMREGSAKYWPTPNYQCRGVWADGPQCCYARMLANSLNTQVGSPTFGIAATAVLKAACIEPAPGIELTHYIVALNESGYVFERIGRDPPLFVPARPFDELKRLIAVAADSLDGGEQPAEGQPAEPESLPQGEPPADAPVEMPPPNPMQDDAISPNPLSDPTTEWFPTEQPTPLPTALTDLLKAPVKEKEFA